ncbi:hypothetical protein MLD38_022809 [Melastoma candidum]|uniref:Uncharacterized protein n=1 Tax=Melastoma candidum TaxID=119954 RepID=A0ACB9QJN3_9MYRT|nr:hypothetical protein MLD38_022809 [Melastoma candidum]
MENGILRGGEVLCVARSFPSSPPRPNPNLSSPPTRTSRLQVPLCLLISSIRCVRVGFSFMSIQAEYLGHIGLPGEYCPWSRKKNRRLAETVSCMHLELFRQHPEFQRSIWLRPRLAPERQSFTSKGSKFVACASAAFSCKS